MSDNSAKFQPSDQFVRFGRDQYSSEEQAAIQRALQARLGPNFISKVSINISPVQQLNVLFLFQRPVRGVQHAAYLEGHRAVSLANEIFGYNGWSHSVSQKTIDFVDHSQVEKLTREFLSGPFCNRVNSSSVSPPLSKCSLRTAFFTRI